MTLTSYWALVFLARMVVFGSVFLEGWSYFQSLFFTVTTLTTVGYGDLVPTNPASGTYTIVLMIMSMSVISLAIGEAGEYVKDQPCAVAGVGRRRAEGELKA